MSLALTRATAAGGGATDHLRLLPVCDEHRSSDYTVVVLCAVRAVTL
jgi:hypothetical protein